METIAISPERKAQLDDFARRHGHDAATALDQALAEYLDWEREDFTEAVAGIQEGLSDLKAGRVQPLDEALEDLRREHDFPR